MTPVMIAVLCVACVAGGLMVGFAIGYCIGREEGYEDALRQCGMLRNRKQEDDWCM